MLFVVDCESYGVVVRVCAEIKPVSVTRCRENPFHLTREGAGLDVRYPCLCFGSDEYQYVWLVESWNVGSLCRFGLLLHDGLPSVFSLTEDLHAIGVTAFLLGIQGHVFEVVLLVFVRSRFCGSLLFVRYSRVRRPCR